MSEVNDYQVGGGHYRSAVQHWDFVEINGLGYLEGCATKYVSRNRKKHAYLELFVKIAALFGVTMPNRVQDLDKAIHYCKKLLEFCEAGRTNRGYRSNGYQRLLIPVEDFARANELTPQETMVAIR